jgi:hypothetical protein
MTAREIIRRCVHFQKPPRVGRFCGRFGQNDIVNVFEFFQKDANGFDVPEENEKTVLNYFNARPTA